MTRTITKATWQEVEAEVVNQGSLAVVEIFGRLCLESPEVALLLSGLGVQGMQGGALVYEAMQRQIRKDALAALERTR